MPSVAQAAPRLGSTLAHGGAGVGGMSQNQTGVPSGWLSQRAQGGPGGPGSQLQGTHEQTVPPENGQTRLVSVQVPLVGAVPQPAGAGPEQYFAVGGETLQAPLTHDPLERQSPRGWSPHVQASLTPLHA